MKDALKELIESYKIVVQNHVHETRDYQVSLYLVIKDLERILREAYDD
jgi:hypothetical protein